ncbi:hypothetical protein PTTG_25101 [Puccinia triticina 1-1 BBBD Race 1]|uniref:Uncharacterized protein n=1 Tax=Puccinia triticina (isolate 1-1 / race 1 (BBBD)) TaxID=630390 RepID=A0A180H5G8_PUCT1|nr:hypothetical protein PTTG_25101 [Puccinia triticina 1-1 BBBD Race 1]
MDVGEAIGPQFLIHSILPHERKKLATSIVDFSKAQQKGFVAAYMARNRAIMRADEEFRFESMCIGLLEPTNPAGQSHEARIDELRRRFTKTTWWLDWWKMADVEAMLFPSRQPMLEDFPDGEDGLPSSTNAQESLHCPGKKCMLKGMVHLYAFFKALERDHGMVMRGMTIRYGSQPKKQVSISKSIGWTKPTKQQRAATKERAAAKNNGHPPDTTKLLLDEKPAKWAKTGQPPSSVNIDQNRHTTYASYAAAKPTEQKALSNRCWLAAALESLYATFSPLWLKESGGKETNLFNRIVAHFSSWATHELTEIKGLLNFLTMGSRSLFDDIQTLRPNSFVPGKFASCNLFIESILDPKRNSCKSLRSFFLVDELRIFTCPCHKAQILHPREQQSTTTLRIKGSMFEQNGISRTDPAQLITLWSTVGLAGFSGLHCKSCQTNSKKKNNQKGKKIEESTLSDTGKLQEQSVISSSEANPPAHLHFHIESATILDEDEQDQFMSEMNWPFKLTVFGEEYTLISRGFFGHSHYCGQVLRHANGLLGVWRHDDQLNGGCAYMVDAVPGSISGPQEQTSKPAGSFTLEVGRLRSPPLSTRVTRGGSVALSGECQTVILSSPISEFSFMSICEGAPTHVELSCD